MIFTITGFTTPNSQPNDYTVLSSYDSLGYQIDQSLDDIQFLV